MGQNNPDFCSSLGCSELFLKWYLTLCFDGSLNQSHSVLKRWYFLLQCAHKQATPPPGCHNSRRWKGFCSSAFSRGHTGFRVYRFLLFLVVLNLSASFPSRLCLSLYPLSFLYLHLPPFSHPACCLEESLKGPLTGRTGSIVPASGHRAAGSVRAAFIDFRLCRVIKGYSAILVFNSSKDAGETAGEAALQVVGTLHEIDLFVCFQVKQNMMIPSLSSAFVAVHLWTLIKKAPEKSSLCFSSQPHRRCLFQFQYSVPFSSFQRLKGFATTIPWCKHSFLINPVL